ncbi:chorismate-binding protein [Glutamicibacter sp.]|uniref:chorismate-binding protein n=1 Tax=Glutamicibacter sp. TaxID=1931995 RepID=UPI0028BD77AC|nr:chorismate-binding protein [Glutamicibacter sp.]
METARPFIIALDGRSGSGKSNFASSLAQHLAHHTSVAVLRLEDTYHGWDGLLDACKRYSRLLPALASGQSISFPTWNWDTNIVDGSQEFTPAAVVIIEGVGAANRAASAWIDFSIWLEAPEAQRKKRALARDGETYAPHWQRWADQETSYIASDAPGRHTDLVLSTDGASLALEQFLNLASYLPANLREQFGVHAHGSTAPELLGEYAAPADAAALFELLAEGVEHAALLESTSHHLPDPLQRNQYSLLALALGEEYPLLRTSGAETTIQIADSTLRMGSSFFSALGHIWPAADIEPAAYPLPAWVGYLGYELKREVGARDIAAVIADGVRRDDARFFAPNVVLVIDHWSNTLTAHAQPEFATWLDSQLLAVGTSRREPAQLAPIHFSCADTQEAYKQKIARAQHEIYEGNTYEVCLTTQLSARVESFIPFEAYCRMRTSSPAPFAHYLKLGPTEVASISPERFLSLSATGLLRAEPIKGTRRRGEDPAEDAVLKHDLATSAKDRAENIMIVDLLRNDLSHHSHPGSVRVTRLCAIESYATVHQMVSTIDAQLRDRALSAQALLEAFPPGSMTGAPKLSTMNILDELEDSRARGLYSGAVGYLGADGSADFSVVIRTLVCDRLEEDGWLLSLGLGGAITADSDAQDEWDEVITKSVGVLGALGSSFPLAAANGSK